MATSTAACAKHEIDKGHKTASVTVHIPTGALKEVQQTAEINIPAKTLAHACGVRDPDLLGITGIKVHTEPAGKVVALTLSSEPNSKNKFDTGLKLDHNSVAVTAAGGAYVCHHIAPATTHRETSFNVTPTSFPTSRDKTDYADDITAKIKTRMKPQYVGLTPGSAADGVKIVERKVARIPAEGKNGPNATHRFLEAQHKADNPVDNFTRVDTQGGVVHTAPVKHYNAVMNEIKDVLTPVTSIGKNGISVRATLISTPPSDGKPEPTHMTTTLHFTRKTPWVNGKGYQPAAVDAPSVLTIKHLHPDTDIVDDLPTDDVDPAASYGFPGADLSKLKIEDAEDVPAYGPEPLHHDEEEDVFEDDLA